MDHINNQGTHGNLSLLFPPLFFFFLFFLEWTASRSGIRFCDDNRPCTTVVPRMTVLMTFSLVRAHLCLGWVRRVCDR
ncbi:hypothetical protein L209DRAFT_139434 [Thermothelomyces heterothallicus CBS 203.75]